jgi:hypothetical protein
MMSRKMLGPYIAIGGKPDRDEDFLGMAGSLKHNLTESIYRAKEEITYEASVFRCRYFADPRRPKWVDVFPAYSSCALRAVL